MASDGICERLAGNMKEKRRYKRWSICVAGMMLAGLLLTAVCNYVIDPYGYFTYQSGEYEDAVKKNRQNTSCLQREYKLEHIKKYGDQYDAYVLGGSKAGSYRADSLSQMDGYRYYNAYNIGGTFVEYENMTRFLIRYGTPKKIIINISGGEVRYEQRDQTRLSVYMPAQMTGKSEWQEYLAFLFKSIKGSVKAVVNGGGRQDFTPGGERSLSREMERTVVDWEGFTQRYVLKPFQKHMQTLFTTDTKLNYYDSALQHMRNIQRMCQEAGVELMVLFAPTFIGEASEHESTYYREFMLRLAWVTDYWDFSGYHDIDLNPYNFYNEGHFYYEVGDLVMQTIAGKASYPGFGTYVTRENAAEHVIKRTQDYQRLQQEYKTTGTIQLKGTDHASCLYSPPFETDTSMVLPMYDDEKTGEGAQTE